MAGSVILEQTQFHAVGCIMSEEKQGCLGSLIRMFGVKPNPRQNNDAVGDLPYRQRDDFLSVTESSFYRVLMAVVDSRATICPKVGLQDVFYVVRPNENVAYLNKIRQKHLDFLLCDPKTMKPFLAIELDDTSHTKPERMERDEFVDRVFKTAKLPLLHVPAQANYSLRSLSELLNPYLPLALDTASSIAAVPTTPVLAPVSPPDATNASRAVPLCPKCGIPMVVRTVKGGEHQGKQFYGCPNYPKCREMKPLTSK
jgi:hypothetical protein